MSLVRGLALLTALLVPVSLRAETPPIQFVLFTHIEDNSPSGMLGSPESRQHYLALRGRLIGLAGLTRDAYLPWSRQPDWKMLQAVLLYEDEDLMESTNGKNFLRYLKEDLDVVIDPHSHENGGYNYTDVAHLLDSLGVGATTVIGGHIWDPSLPQFSEWDRFRVPVAGERYPWAWWRGDILLGSATPGHVNDPIVSGVWQPQDRDHYFTHDPAGNIAAIGKPRGTLESIQELVARYESGVVSIEYMLTSSLGVGPSTILSPNGLAVIQQTIIAPIVALRDNGVVTPTDFTSLVQTWRDSFGSRGFLYDAEAATGVEQSNDGVVPLAEPASARLDACSPSPFTSRTTVRFSVEREQWIRLSIYDVFGREVVRLVDEMKRPGSYTTAWTARDAVSGVYFARLTLRGGERSQDEEAAEAPVGAPCWSGAGRVRAL